MRLLISGLLWLIGAGTGLAQTGGLGPAPQTAAVKPIEWVAYPKTRIRVVIDLISIPRAAAFETVRLDEGKIWNQVLDMMKEGSAVSEYVIALAASDGMGASFEGSEERRYPSEFIPPEVTDGPLKKMTSSDVLLLSILPEAYETRKIGSTMEVKTVTTGNDIQIFFLADITEAHDFWRYPLRLPQAVPAIGQPIFRTVRLQKTIGGKIGAPLFIQSTDFSRNGPSGNSDRLLLAFVTAIRD